MYNAPINQSVYSQILGAAETFLGNNLNTFGRDFANWFMNNHQPNMADNAKFLYDFVGSRTTNGQIDAQALFRVVGEYISHIFQKMHQPQQPTQNIFGAGGQFGGSQFGGFGQQSPAPTGGFMQSSSNNGGFFTNQPAPQQQQPQAQPQAAPVQIQPVTTVQAGFLDAYNPLSGIPDDVDILKTDEQPNWGEDTPMSSSILFIDRKMIHTRDDQYKITMCNMFERQYYNNPLDVVKDFFAVAPDKFMAENFIARIFYNHVEVVDVSTPNFSTVCNHFTDTMRKRYDQASRDPTQYDLAIYKTIMAQLNDLKHGPRMALAKYLVSHINRALRLSCGMASAPATRISFENLEDLDELLGPNFQHPLLDVPNGRAMISNIVNTAIVNAMTQYSDVMFRVITEAEVDIIRTSPVFPFSMDNVYPNKWTIPSPQDPQFGKFKDNLDVYCRDRKTYVRSIRSVIITNVLTGKELSGVQKAFSRIDTPWANLFKQFIIPHKARTTKITPLVSDFDEALQALSTDEAYADFTDDPEGFVSREGMAFYGRDIPTTPVDQTLFALQYKTSPHEFLMAMDLGTTMDTDESHPRSLLLAKREFDELHLVQ